ncbi:DUF2277 family protein [Rhizobium ruizarguesonis]|nr:DUF2277 family protein [Rhizobium ruizarguesonis]
MCRNIKTLFNFDPPATDQRRPVRRPARLARAHASCSPAL